MTTGCPAGARCETVTYFEPTTQLPSATQYTNRDGNYRNFNGFEVTFAKRFYMGKYEVTQKQWLALMGKFNDQPGGSSEASKKSITRRSYSCGWASIPFTWPEPGTSQISL